MTRIVSFVLALMTVLPFGIINRADACQHEREATLLPADCSHRERTEYYCSECDDRYYIDTIDIEEPEDFALVLRTEREGDTVTLTGTLFNNPGLVTARIIVYFDPEVVSLNTFTNGVVFTDSQYTVGVSPASDHVTLFTEVITNISNLNNGLYFTMTFDVLSEGDYGIRATVGSKDLNDWDPVARKIIFRSLNVINLQGKEKYGDHAYGEFVTTVEPTFDTTGISVSTCEICGAEIEREIPCLIRWMVGDLNNDGKVNSTDINSMTRMIVNGTSNVYAYDAADVNRDGHVNATDSNLISRMVVGD